MKTLTRQAAAVVALISALVPRLAAEEPAEHKHTPMSVTSPPVISKLKVAFAIPHRVLVEPDGDVLVADVRAGVVFRVSPRGTTVVLADGLDEPVGLARDRDNNVYVATRAGNKTGLGSVFKVTPDGEREAVCGDLTGVTDIARDRTGNLFVSNRAGQVLRFNPDGERTIVVSRLGPVTSVLLDQNERLYVANAKRIVRLDPRGRVIPVAAGFRNLTDLAMTRDGRMVIADREAKKLFVMKKGKPAAYASVPIGTTAVSFTSEGNMLVVNRELQSVTRVTTRMSVPCPHCSKKIPLILKRPTPGHQSF